MVPSSPLDARLRTVAALVRPHKKLADIGSDHAYLPIFLCREHIIPAAIATDIHRGPLRRAQQHIHKAQLDAYIQTKLCDGFQTLENDECEEFAVCGMGGDLIARMIDDAPMLQNPALHLILQPMTAQSVLRSYLWTHGFDIVQERLCRTDRIYQVFSVFYTGKNSTYTPLEQLIGKYHLTNPLDPLLPCFLAWQRKFVAARMAGKARGGVPHDTEQQLLEELDAFRATLPSNLNK